MGGSAHRRQRGGVALAHDGLHQPQRARSGPVLSAGGVRPPVDVRLGLMQRKAGIAHVGQVGGVLFGFVYFGLRTVSQRKRLPPPRTVERVVMVQSGSSEPERGTPTTPVHTRRRIDTDPVAAEV